MTQLRCATDRTITDGRPMLFINIKVYKTTADATGGRPHNRTVRYDAEILLTCINDSTVLAV